MGHSAHDPATKGRPAWNAGPKLGAKRALKPQQVWAIRFWLDRERRTREASLIYKGTGDLRAVQILLGHTKIEGTVRSLGVGVEDAVTLAEGTEI